MTMSRIRIALFENRAQAEPACQRLGQAGIRAEVHYESALSRLWFVPKRRTGVRLEVPAKDTERATQLLLESDGVYELLRSAIRCPECRSLRVEFPQFTEKSLLTNVAMGLMAELRIVDREYYCENCHCMWAKPAAKAQSVRPHMAPNYFLGGFRGETQPKPNGSLVVARGTVA
jgi:hypothetical protein